MSEIDDRNESDLTSEMFYSALNDLKKYKADTYKFIIYAGESFKNALYTLFKLVWEKERKPDQWKLDTLIQIHKKESKQNLDNYRYIHLKEDIPKFFGVLVTKEIKERIVKSFSKYQIGAAPGHRPQEHLFCVRSLISLYSMMKKPLIIALYDISKIFDKEVLVDAMDACYRAGVKGKLYRLLFLMNKDTKIEVKTGTGVSRVEETGENVGQGTVEGAIVSAKNIDTPMDDTFSKSCHEISYGDESLQPLLYQDDILRASDTLESLEAGNRLIEHVMNEKLLSLNIGKSNYMIIGKNKLSDELRRSVKDIQIKLDDCAMNKSETEKYLGDYFHENGNSQSIIITVKMRFKKAMNAISDIKSVVEDTRANVFGAVKVGLEIFELCVIPFLLYNSEVWDHIPTEALKLLNDFQLKFLRSLLKTPRTTPIPSLLWETGTLEMNERIDKRKMMFFHHVQNLDENSLARKFAQIQT